MGVAPKKKSMSGKLNKFSSGGVFYVLIELQEIDPAIHDDQATLESSDGTYKKMLKVGSEGVKIDKEHLRLAFPGVVPGKLYTLVYDLKKDGKGNDLGKMTLFQSMEIRADQLNVPEGVSTSQESALAGEVEPWATGGGESMIESDYEEPDPDIDYEKKFVSEESTSLQQSEKKAEGT